MIVINNKKEIGKLKKLLSDINRFNVGDVISLHILAKNATEIVFCVGFEPTPMYLNSSRLVTDFRAFIPKGISFEEPRVRVLIHTPESDLHLRTPLERSTYYPYRSSIFIKDPEILATAIKDDKVESIILRENYPMEFTFLEPIMIPWGMAVNDVGTVLDPNKENYFFFVTNAAQRIAVYQKDSFKPLFDGMKEEPKESPENSEVMLFKDFFPNQPQYVEVYSRVRGDSTAFHARDVYVKSLYTGGVMHHVQYTLVGMGN